MTNYGYRALGPRDLCNLVRLPFDRLADIDFNNAIFDANCIKIECPWSGRTHNIPSKIKGGGMTGTDESSILLYPGNGTTEVRTLTGKGEKTSVLEACQIELSLWKRGDRVGLEPV